MRVGAPSFVCCFLNLCMSTITVRHYYRYQKTIHLSWLTTSTVIIHKDQIFTGGHHLLDTLHLNVAGLVYVTHHGKLVNSMNLAGPLELIVLFLAADNEVVHELQTADFAVSRCL